MRYLVPLLMLLTALSVPLRAAETDWKKYANDRFGFVLFYPKALIAEREPTNGAGRNFRSADNEFSMVAQSHFLQKDDGDSLEKRWADELRELGSTITYKRKTADWYVVSGVAKDGTEFYHKLWVKGGNWVGLDITYPHSKAAKYDLWVEEITKRFVPFSKGNFDRAQ